MHTRRRPAACRAPRRPPSHLLTLSAALTNDHKALSKQAEQLLYRLHAASNQAGGAAPAPAAAATAAATAAARPPAAAAAVAGGGGGYEGPPPPPPFAVIDELTPGSPAADAGLLLGDQLCSFGGVTRETPSTLQAVAAALAANEGRPVAAVVLRQGAPLELHLTPRQWGGRGLLGCHLRPL